MHLGRAGLVGHIVYGFPQLLISTRYDNRPVINCRSPEIWDPGTKVTGIRKGIKETPKQAIMFCPICGKDNLREQRFCASCGTNLEAVSSALSGREEDFFTRTDNAMDQFIARYTEHVFKNSRLDATDQKVARSWQLLGKAVLTTFVDLILLCLMWNFLPLRFLMLLISTPFRLLSERSKQQSLEEPPIDAYKPPDLPEPASRLWLNEQPVPSVTEGTTLNLTPVEIRSAPTTDRLK